MAHTVVTEGIRKGEDRNGASRDLNGNRQNRNGTVPRMIKAILVIALFLMSTILMLYLILRRPIIHLRFRNRKISFSSYFTGALLAPVLLVFSGLLNYSQLIDAIHGNVHLNPLGILLLFFSMVFMSIFLDTSGFFEFCARSALK
ncbi:MAG: hypothetical protein QHG99_04730 [Methanomicrobiales archaeon]|nr:hypothetical protein [Methanomicrobiales archaeon]